MYEETGSDKQPSSGGPRFILANSYCGGSKDDIITLTHSLLNRLKAETIKTSVPKLSLLLPAEFLEPYALEALSYVLMHSYGTMTTECFEHDLRDTLRDGKCDKHGLFSLKLQCFDGLIGGFNPLLGVWEHSEMRQGEIMPPVEIAHFRLAKGWERYNSSQNIWDRFTFTREAHAPF